MPHVLPRERLPERRTGHFAAGRIHAGVNTLDTLLREPAEEPRAGLVLYERQSGYSVRGRVRLSKIGSGRLRKVLYFPAITALRCSSFSQERAEGLR